MNIKNTLINGIRRLFLNNMPRVGKFGAFDDTSIIIPPADISGRQNIFISRNCNIGTDAVLYATNARIIIKQYFVAARGLRIITGSHERRIGRFCGSISEEEKNKNLSLDRDVIINEDVWTGIDVTILPGVEIGRGATIAACSVVTRSVPPYSIFGGHPARFIKFYWTIDEILEHERLLYDKEDRFSRDQLECFFNLYSRNL